MSEPSKIERWLKEYARRRRQAAGSDFELPAAMRQRLLAEVRRQYEPRESRFLGWRAGWARLAWTGALALAALLTLYPVLHRPASRTEADMTLARNVASPGGGRPGEATARSASGTEGPARTAPPLAMDEASHSPGTSGRALETEAAASSPRERRSSAVAAPRRDGGTLVARTPARRDSAPAPVAPTPVKATEAGVRPSAAAPSMAKAIRSGVADPPIAAVVLNTFEIVQNGNAIQIRDQDGSVYAGEVVAQPGAPPAVSNLVADNIRVAATASAPVSNSTAVESAANAVSFATNLSPSLYFRVAGMNRSLGQNVELEARLAEEPLGPGAPSNAVANFANPANALANPRFLNLQGQALAPNASNPTFANTTRNFGVANSLRFQNFRPGGQEADPSRNSLNNGRVRGQAWIGGTNRLVIDAVNID